jgi:hypothetical protein
MPSWNWLNLNRTELPGSAFPERADVYVCDNCDADITKYLRLHAAHARPAYGPMRYRCVCGTKYLTGTLEWDDLSSRQQRSRVLDLPATFLFGFVIMWIVALPVGLIAWLIFHTVKAGLVVALVVAMVPALVFPVIEVAGILRSIIRTRFISGEQAPGVRS